MLNSPRKILADCCVAPSTLNTWKGKTLKAFKSQLLLKACKWLEMTGKFLPVAASCPVTGSAAHCLAPLSKRCSLQCRRSVQSRSEYFSKVNISLGWIFFRVNIFSKRCSLQCCRSVPGISINSKWLKETPGQCTTSATATGTKVFHIFGIISGFHGNVVMNKIVTCTHFINPALIINCSGKCFTMNTVAQAKSGERTRF